MLTLAPITIYSLHWISWIFFNYELAKFTSILDFIAVEWMWPENEKNGFGEKMWRGGREIGGKHNKLFSSNALKVPHVKDGCLTIILVLETEGSEWWISAKKDSKIKREMLFWRFGARFWPGVILGFLNETSSTAGFYLKWPDGSYRFCSHFEKIL